MKKNLNADYWNNRYKTNEAAWDLGSVSTPLKEYFDTLKNKGLKILIPGAGNCYEGEYLLKKKFSSITILDYAPEALEGFKERVRGHKKVKLVCDDFFLHKGKYDIIIEQTFFCALDPSLRQAYVKQMHNLLKKKGKLVGLLFTSVPNKEGPPFAGTIPEYKKLFSKHFEIKNLEPCYNSIKPREGRELFFTLVKK